MTARLARFLPPVLWMGVIAVFSGELFGAERTGSWVLPLLARLLPGVGPGGLHALHAALRKLGHLTEYGLLAALWLRALGEAPRATAWALGLSVLYAGVDEARQGLAPTRSPSLLDVALDAAGALLAVACLRPRAPLAVVGLRLARWAAVALAAGSLVAAALDWSLGLTAWDLLVATGLAAGVAVGLGRLERAWRAPT